jgi:redox-sensitive bicupin YhaK (pirin superfamily)
MDNRRITQRAHGRQHGPVIRVIDPLTHAHALKPFVLLDYFDIGSPNALQGFGMHPHSGIGTVTLLIEGGLAYEDSTGKSGLLPPGSLEWMRAGAGVWHTGALTDDGRARGFQLWVALPSELEHASSESLYITPDRVEQDGPARVTLGSHGAARSPVTGLKDINYVHVRLEDGQRWHYSPPERHEIAWVFPCAGELRTPERVGAGELAIFEESNSPLDFRAVGNTEFVMGSAVKHPQDLVLGYYSIHSSIAAMERGAAEIERIGRKLLGSGRIDEERLLKALEKIRPGNW